MRAVTLKGLVLLGSLLGSACGGKGESLPAAEGVGSEPEAGQGSVPSNAVDGSGSGTDVVPAPVTEQAQNPVTDTHPDGAYGEDTTPAGPVAVVVDAASLDACSFHAQEDRVAVHHRAPESGTCLDLILVRLSKGGVAPSGLSMPFDWGVGHMSSYPCTPDGQIVTGESPAAITDVTGNIGMGGGLTGLPASLSLNVTLTAPAPPGSQGRVAYSLAAPALDVSRACEDSAAWARQPLNQQAQLSAISVAGCTYIGGYDRVSLHQRDGSTEICTDLRLVADEDMGVKPQGLELPSGWSVEEMGSYACASDGSAPEAVTPTAFTEAVGTVSFGGGVGGLPRYVWLDVSMSTPDPELPLDPDQVILGQRLFSNDSIDVTGGCSGIGYR